MAKRMKFTPRTAVARRSFKRSKYRSRKRFTRPTLYRSLKSGIGFPQKMTMVHKYYETVDINSVSGSTATYSWNCNGMYDPNYTGSGHQPMYFDQMTALYNHYTVIGAKITVNLAHSVATNTNTTACLYTNDDGTIVPTLNSLIEQSKAKYVVLPVANVDPYRIVMKWSLKKQLGSSRGALTNTALSGSSSANPAESSMWTLAMFPQNVSSTQTYNIQVLIQYIAVWTELKDIAGS